MPRDQAFSELFDCSIRMNELLISYVQSSETRKILQDTINKMKLIAEGLNSE